MVKYFTVRRPDGKEKIGKHHIVEFSELFFLLELKRVSVIKYRCYLRPGSDLVSSSSKSGK